jgi:hypothetical protein
MKNRIVSAMPLCGAKTLDEMARVCGVSPRTLTKFSEGVTITMACAAKISAALTAIEASRNFVVQKRGDHWWAKLPPGIIEPGSGEPISEVAAGNPSSAIDRACRLIRAQYERGSR